MQSAFIQTSCETVGLCPRLSAWLGTERKQCDGSAWRTANLHKLPRRLPVVLLAFVYRQGKRYIHLFAVSEDLLGDEDELKSVYRANDRSRTQASCVLDYSNDEDDVPLRKLFKWTPHSQAIEAVSGGCSGGGRFSDVWIEEMSDARHGGKL